MMTPEIAIRDETPYLVNRNDGFGDIEFLHSIVSAGIRQICLRTPEDRFDSPLISANIVSASETTQWLHTITLAELQSGPYKWNHLFSDLLDCDDPELDVHINKGIVIRCGFNRYSHVDNANLLQSLRGVLEGYYPSMNDFYSNVMRDLDHVEFQVSPEQGTRVDEVKRVIDTTLSEYGDRFHALGLYAGGIPTHDIDGYMQAVKARTGERTVHFSDCAHGKEFVSRSNRAIDQGAKSLSYGMKQTAAYGERPMLPSDFLRQLDASTGIDIEAYLAAYKANGVFKKMDKYFE